MKSIKVKILGPVAVLAVLVLVTSAFSILGAYNILNMLGVSSRGISAHLQELAGLWRKNWQYVIPILFYWQPHLPLWQS